MALNRQKVSTVSVSARNIGSSIGIGLKSGIGTSLMTSHRSFENSPLTKHQYLERKRLTSPTSKESEDIQIQNEGDVDCLLWYEEHFICRTLATGSDYQPACLQARLTTCDAVSAREEATTVKKYHGCFTAIML